QDWKAAGEELAAGGELAGGADSVGAGVGRGRAKMEKSLADFELKAILDGPMDGSNAYLRVQAGTGGTEACDWADMLRRMYIRWAESHGYTVEMVDELPNEEAGIRSATLYIQGDYAYGNLQSETGVHRLVRISPFDSNARRPTS